MRGNKRPERLRAYQWRIPWQYDRKFRPAQRPPRHLHRVPSSVLRLLQNRFRPERLDHWRYLIRLMPHDHHRLFRAQRRACTHHMLDERASSRAVQYLREAGLQPRAFSCRKNDNGQIVIRHEGSILASLPRF